MTGPRIGKRVTAALSEFPERGEQLQEIRFAGAEQGWPPLPLHGGKTRFITLEQSRDSDTVLTSEQLLNSALNDVNVTAALGERYTLITVDAVQAVRDEDRLTENTTCILFYSYSNASSVIVERLDTGDWQVQLMPTLQPCEGDEEIDRAIKLARNDDRIRDRVAALDGRVIHLPVQPESPGSGERVMLVTFLDAKESLIDENQPLFAAAVDLTNGIVLAAGPLIDAPSDGN